MVGSEKKTIEECCESFENGGLGGVHYSIGDLCFDCLNSLGKTITHSLVNPRRACAARVTVVVF